MEIFKVLFFKDRIPNKEITACIKDLFLCAILFFSFSFPFFRFFFLSLISFFFLSFLFSFFHFFFLSFISFFFLSFPFFFYFFFTFIKYRKNSPYSMAFLSNC